MALSTQSLPTSGSRRRQVGTHLSEINVTPFIDVMLVLLVIFMVTAPMMQSGIGVNLPQAETDTKPAEEGLTLTVTKDQYVRVGDSIVNINLLERRLTEYFYNKPKKVVYLQVDKDVPWGVGVRIMDITKKAGVEIVGVITEPIDVKDKRK
ncbi:MAG: biopolymer transporter ExbD [Candidatus Aminicenantes bacterium]|nr:biopolymer transporter ExbD [Candidatus Aminicenantes bacterium]NLH76611.1 biopolymer transporter ExbD [Acidobacteriota bacterium]